jgi:hypothetical protein
MDSTTASELAVVAASASAATAEGQQAHHASNINFTGVLGFWKQFDVVAFRQRLVRCAAANRRGNCSDLSCFPKYAE